MQVFGSTGSGGLTNTIKFVTVGSERVRIDNNGIVGIGTTSPANSKLHIYADHVSGHSVLKIQTITSIASGGVPSLAFFDSDGTRNTLVYAASDGTYLANEVNKPIIFSTNSTQKMTIASTGLVGIGTTVPASLLHVYSTSSEPAIRLTSTSGSAKTYGLVCNTAWAPGSFHIYDYTADVTRIHISSGGNVGIGVGATSPATKLYVVSSGSPIARFDGSSVASSGATEIDVLGPQSNGDLNLGIGGSTFTDATNNIQNKAFITAGTGLTGLNLRSDAGYVQITTGGTASSNERMRITSDGNVGIGTVAPAAKLEISGSSNSALLNIKSPISGAILYVSGSGAVGINTSTVGAYTLQVNGSFAATTKSFVIEHPTKAGKKLIYGSLESPYHGIRLTGRDTLVNGKCKIQLPDYMYKLILHDSVNIQLTGIKCNKTLYVDEINIPENYFTIAYDKAIFESYKDYDFFWDFTGIRTDVPELITEL